MSKYRAVPQGCMTVGEVAKKMGTTVRTLQYYDKEGLLSPSATSEGGRRLYMDKDVIKLHQILSLKSLGFSLDDIKNRLITLDTPQDVAGALAEHAVAIREKLDSLSESLRAIEALRAEVLQMQMVDFKKYADIIVCLQMNNEMYWAIKHMDDDMMEHVKNRFDRESSKAFIEKQNRIADEMLRLQSDGIAPESEAGQALAAAYWSLIEAFMGGDMSLFSKMIEFAGAIEDKEWQKRQQLVHAFFVPAVTAYFTKIGCNPFEENGLHRLNVD
ncbi:MAG: MerR family transcriptional regulator [Oscillospiraceae bacterium]|nr:MerR family transcriptional regulator [Oscillospiraceae bacterium]